jgi:hypothetical protein
MRPGPSLFSTMRRDLDGAERVVSAMNSGISL